MPAPSPTLGSLLRHLLELLDGDVERTYRNAGLDYRPRFTPVMRALDEAGAQSIREIAVYAGITHSAASQTVAEMLDRKLVLIRPGADARERIVHLTPKGRTLLPSLREFWRATNAAADELGKELRVPLPEILAEAIQALEKRPFVDRIASKRASRERHGARKVFTSVASLVAIALMSGQDLHGQSASETARVVNLVATQMEQSYVFPEVGRRVAGQLRMRVRLGAYRVAPGEPLAKELSNDLRSLTGDGHLSVEYNATPLPPEDSTANAEMSRRDRERYYGPRLNYGFRKMELLSGNVGYLEVTVFAPLEWAGPVATAAMTMVAQADALIIDLRRNGGGHGETVQWLESYLFEGPQQVSGEYNRIRNSTSEGWTLPWVPGPRFGPKRPVFILTSRRTFSAAEAMAYDLQALGRATIVGETSGGGAHPYENVKLDAHYVLGLPMSRSVNPITKGNWQGTGVRPDVAAPADSALAVALSLAHQRVGIDAEVRALMARHNVQGLGLAIIDGGTVRHVAAYGWRNAERKLPLTPQTIMYGASLTKTAFAYMIMQLVDEGRLDLDASIATMLPRPLPEFEDYTHLAGDDRWRALTPRILLNHASGFANFRWLEEDKRLRFHFTPGARYAYSGEGFYVLQLVLEQGLGLDVGKEMQARVFDRFGMTNTSMKWRPDFAANLADGYGVDGSMEPHDERSSVSAAGSMDTSIEDQARLWAGIVRGDGLTPKSRAELVRPGLSITSAHQFPTLRTSEDPRNADVGLAAGLGLVTFADYSGPAWFKGGHNDWTGNMVVCLEKGRRCVVMLSNDVRGERIFPDIVRLALGETRMPWRWEYGWYERGVQ